MEDKGSTASCTDGASPPKTLTFGWMKGFVRSPTQRFLFTKQEARLKGTSLLRKARERNARDTRFVKTYAHCIQKPSRHH